jgi:hypothetical protein
MEMRLKRIEGGSEETTNTMMPKMTKKNVSKVPSKPRWRDRIKKSENHIMTQPPPQHPGCFSFSISTRRSCGRCRLLGGGAFEAADSLLLYRENGAGLCGSGPFVMSVRGGKDVMRGGRLVGVLGGVSIRGGVGTGDG